MLMTVVNDRDRDHGHDAHDDGRDRGHDDGDDHEGP